MYTHKGPSILHFLKLTSFSIVLILSSNLSLLQAQNVFYVDTWFDDSDANPGDGVCATANGECTFRAAIEEANEFPNAGSADVISFEQIPLLSGLAVITSEANYKITSPVIIDGTTSSGEIILNGTDLPGLANGITVNANGSTIRGLTIGNFIERSAIKINGNSNVIEQNYLGVTQDGTLMRNGRGVYVQDGHNNRIGGIGDALSFDELGNGNVIGGNSGYGIFIFEGDNNFVRHNFIGVSLTGQDIGNTDRGVYVFVGEGNVIGGPTHLHGNLIGNNGNGISLESGTTSSIIRNNYIGTDPEGNDYGNSYAGIVLVLDPSVNKIGGTKEQGNVIGFNQVGIEIVESPGNSIKGNFIGVNREGTPIGNHGPGIRVFDPVYVFSVGSSNTIIGYPQESVIPLSMEKGNVIAWNDGPGIVIAEENSVSCSIRGNSIFNNNASGIDLGDDGLTVNDSDDADIGQNQLQNYPVIQRAFYRPGNNAIAIEFTVSSDDTIVNYPLTIDAYLADDDASWEGETYIGTVSYETPNANGLFEIPADDVEWALEDVVVLTATDADGNTSEFSPASTPLSDADGGPVSAINDLQVDNQINKGGVDAVQFSSPYPNPFNPQATFSLTLSERQHVRISVLDLLGREVDLLHSDPLAPGASHEFTIDGSSFSSGTYFVRVQGDQFVEMKQVTLLK
ncbi:MAG: T9SS type A sorting domain-containing protein [Rhodothermaceae bacterium]|nr:T9SS type A sorting domain-containing protein [Rhodothermaceae bacterium]